MKSLHKIIVIFLLLFFGENTDGQSLDSTFLKQSILVRPSLTLKDYGLNGKVSSVEIISSNSDIPATTTKQKNYFSKSGFITKLEFYPSNHKDEIITWNYYYSLDKLDSITTNDGTRKQTFFYDSNDRMVMKQFFGKYDDTKNDIEETEHYFYNERGFIEKAINDTTQVVIQCLYDNSGRLERTNLYNFLSPEDVNVSEHYYDGNTEKIVTKKNKKILSTDIIKLNSFNQFDEIDSTQYDGQKLKFTYDYSYDQKQNFINLIEFVNGIKNRTETRKIIYYSDRL